MAGLLGQKSQDWTNQNRTTTVCPTGQPRYENQGWGTRRGQDSQDKIGHSEQDNHNWTARKGQTDKSSEKRITRTGQAYHYISIFLYILFH